MEPPGSPRGPRVLEARVLEAHGYLRPMPLGPPWAPPWGPFSRKKIFVALPQRKIIRLHEAGGPMGPQIYDLSVLYT